MSAAATSSTSTRFNGASIPAPAGNELNDRSAPVSDLVDQPWRIDGGMNVDIVDDGDGADPNWPIVEMSGRMRLTGSDGAIDLIGRGRVFRIEVGGSGAARRVLKLANRLADSASPLWQLAQLLSLSVEVTVHGVVAAHFDASNGDREAALEGLADSLGVSPPDLDVDPEELPSMLCGPAAWAATEPDPGPDQRGADAGGRRTEAAAEPADGEDECLRFTSQRARRANGTGYAAGA